MKVLLATEHKTSKIARAIKTYYFYFIAKINLLSLRVFSTHIFMWYQCFMKHRHINMLGRKELQEFYVRKEGEIALFLKDKSKYFTIMR